jgi:hypothetical protein
LRANRRRIDRPGKNRESDFKLFIGAGPIIVRNSKTSEIVAAFVFLWSCVLKSISQTVDTQNFPLSKSENKAGTPVVKPEEKVDTSASGLAARLKEAIAIPVPGNNDYWQIEDLSKPTKNEGVLSRLLKRKELSADEITVLKKEAIQSPGNTRAKIQKLKRQFPCNSELYMLSAICTNGMLLNSSNRDEVLRGLKYAVKEAATGLISNGISLYNCESFFKIYFFMLDRLKREQAKTLGMLSEDPRMAGTKGQLINSIKAVDFLYSEKSKVSNVVNHLKKKLKSSNYIALFNPHDIKEAAHYIEKGMPKEPCKIGTASEMISYIYALALTFSHTPLLGKLVNKILSFLPDKNVSLLVRKLSINSIRRFVSFKLALAEGDREEMIKTINLILRENLMGLSKWGTAPVYFSYEADLFFNLAYVAELTPGILPNNEYLDILEKAIKAMETLAEKDMSKGHMYTDNANSHLRRLMQLKEDKKPDPNKNDKSTPDSDQVI